MHSPAPARGFTLLELLVAFAVVAILFAVGVPALGGWIAEQQLHDRADALLHALDLARSEAIKRGTRIDLCPGSGACDAGPLPWEGGWTVVPDRDRTTRGGVLAREPAAMPGITIRGNRPVADYVSYTSAGHARRLDGALQMGTFTVCRRGLRARKVVLANSGRARIETSEEICP